MKQLKVILEDRLADLLEHQTIDKKDFVPLVLADIAQDIGTPSHPQHGREPDKVKPLAQYLGDYVEHETELELIDTKNGLVSWRELLEQALDAYQSIENVTIKIERI